jgi:hypothetical protein
MSDKPTKQHIQLRSIVYGLESKSLDDNLVIGGIIATTHIDQGKFREDLGKTVKDKIEKDTLESWALLINEGNPQANKVTVQHNRDDKVAAGVAVKGSAKVMPLPDGEYGLYVDTVFDKTHPDYNSTKNRIDIGTYDGFSIEFVAGETQKYDDLGDCMVRHLYPDSELHGYAVAARPMNPNAIMLKEIFPDKKTVSGDLAPQTPSSQDTGSPVQLEMKEVKMEQKAITVEELKELETLRAEKKSAEEAAMKLKYQAELKESLMNDLLAKVKDVKVESKVMVNKPSIEMKEFMAFKEAIAPEKKVSVDEAFKRAGQLAEALGMFKEGIPADRKMAESREYKFSTNGTKLEYKGLGITTNQNSDTDYLLSAAELRDVFDPVIYTALNETTVAWNLLRKEDFSGKGNNQVQFTIQTAANATAGWYAGDDIVTGADTKLKLQTKFKKCAVGVQVSGDMIAAAKGGPFGDIFAEQVRSASVTLLHTLNQAIFGVAGAETDAAPIGLQYICNSGSYTTLYSITRSSTTLSANVALNPSAAGDTYINGASADVTLANMRAQIRQAVTNGAQLGNLVFITHPIQIDKLREKYDASQRLMPTSSRFGFEGRPEFDGVPIFADADCTSTLMFLVDLETYKVAIWVPPTLEMLGKSADNVAGFIKTYLATYCTNVRRHSMQYALAVA